MGDVNRRFVIAGTCGVCATALAGCAAYGSGNAAPRPAPPAQPGPSAGGAAPATGAPAAGGAGLASTADVPVGGGLILADQDLVITQPAAGTFKGFSATCTHTGCTVNEVTGGTINCPCHGSMYAIADGSVAGGPAPRPLPAKNVKVTGTAITLA